MTSAIALSEWYIHEAIRIFRSRSTTISSSVNALRDEQLHWIITERKGTVTTRQFARQYFAIFKGNNTAAADALQALADDGYGRYDPGVGVGKGGRGHTSGQFFVKQKCKANITT
jgi:hypothetical protein